MDDIFGILFYIILIVLGGIISAYRNKNKRKLKIPPLSGPQQDPVIVETPASGYDPFKEFTEKYGFEVDETVVSSEPMPEIVTQPDLVSLETQLDTPEEQGVPVFEETRVALDPDSEQDGDLISRDQISDSSDFEEDQKQYNIDVKGNIYQAIIYSEILKRKHF